MPRYPALSSAADGLSASVYTGLTALAAEHARVVYPLHVGDTHRLPPACARSEQLRVNEHDKLHNYAEVQGEPALLDAVQSWLQQRQTPVERACLQVTAGATSGLTIASRALLSPGDEVLLLEPYWPLIRGIISATGAKPVQIPFFTELEREDFDIAAELEQRVTERTVAVYLNTPHNPTGAVLDATQLDAIADVVERHDLWVLADQAYETLWFGDVEPPTAWMHDRLGPRSVVAHTLSKSFGIAGARIGFLHGPEQQMSAIRGLQTFETYCAAKPMQLLGARALTEPEGDMWAREAREEYAWSARMAAEAVGVPTPPSGTFLFFDTRPFLRDGESPRQLLERCARRGVVLTQGGVTGEHYASWARLCFTAVAPEQLGDALGLVREELHAR